MQKYHLIGIKGTGMSALAKVLKDLGNIVTGSDVKDYYFTEKSLYEKGIEIQEFSEKNIDDENIIYIASSCYGKDNVEVKKVLDLNYKFYYYHEFIEYYFKNIKIGVSGAHGKTTTTSFITDLFDDYRICSIIGDGRGKGIIDYEYVIFEACEYKDHILAYTFDYLIINNVDLEHLDYFANRNEINNTFMLASSKADYLIAYEDVKINHPNRYTFGKSKDCFCHYEIIHEYTWGYDLRIFISDKVFDVIFKFPGVHMINNLLASITVYYLVFKNVDCLKEKILNLKNPKRRMEEHIYKTNILIDDYAHHPTEIKALILAIKQKYPNKNIIVLFQPHTYSRSILLKKEFENCFSGVDELYVDNTFTSKREKYSFELEEEVFGIFSNALHFTDDIVQKLKEKENSVIVFLGAGEINKYISFLTKNSNL